MKILTNERNHRYLRLNSDFTRTLLNPDYKPTTEDQLLTWADYLQIVHDFATQQSAKTYVWKH